MKKNNMLPSLPLQKKRLSAGKKITVFLLFFIFIASAIFTPIKPAQAQLVVTDIPKLVWDKVQDVAKTLWRKGGSVAFQQTLRSALNKIAYDTANWVGSGKQGQKPLFVTEGWGSYMARIGDEAAGEFLERFASNWSVSTGSGHTMNLCQPSSIDVKVRIALGLANQQRPQGPNCTATQMVSNWKTAAQKYTDFSDPNYLKKFVNIFDPVSSDLGIFITASTDMSKKELEASKSAQTILLGKGGWLDASSIAGTPGSLPNQAQLQTELAYQSYAANFNRYTGDAFIDAANIFLNQLAIASFNRLVQNLGKKNPSAPSSSPSLGFESDPSSTGGESALKSATMKLIQPNFGVKADYSILSELMMCPDKNNPGPTNCVIDNKFMQAISEQKTVAEALQEGYLNGSWQFLIDGGPGSYENSYSWRNVSILRKYRIVPASWEEVFRKMERIATQSLSEPARFQPKKATLMDLVSCFSPYDDFNQFSSQFDASDQAWCTGLVDPYWVLKAPLNFCKKEGVSSQIINKFVIPSQPAFGTNPYIPSTVNILRAENYCADHQTCIKEAKDGSCVAYGYCNEEKRTWSFDGDSCEPINNTCQAFVNSSSRQRVAYLENTLDYEGCSAENAGCKQYSNVGTYDTVRGTVAWNPSGSIYFNNKIEDCTSRDEGCSEFIRVKPAWGANLVMNSGFINDQVGASTTGNLLNDWPVSASRATIVDATLEPGGNSGKALKLEGGSVSVYSNAANSLLPTNLDVIEGQIYTVSADVYLQGGSKTAISLGSGTANLTYESQARNAWHHISVSRPIGADFNSPSFTISADGTLYVKNIKFEMSGWDTGYSSYGANKVYQKLLPQYLESACYVGNTPNGFSYQMKVGAPAACYNYARRCDRGEAGCELFRSGRNDFAVPAKVSASDYCPGECVGYDVYISRETYFNSAQAENLIPKTAQKCSANVVGCNEFTNLDDLATGGERREYYSALKHCVKPGQATCGNFYSWEGTSSGYQLRVHSLQMGVNGPHVIANDSALCNEPIFNAPVNSPLYNPDCRQFYDSAGQVFYHLNSHIVTCSDDCRAYRITEKNYDRRLTQGECSGTARSWDAQEGACISCLNGGTWSSSHGACVYQGIPGEGKTCSAQDNGCREYNGNAGNNVKLITSHNFEAPSSAWTSNCTNGISLVNISSNRDGRSLYYNNSASACSDIGSESHQLSKSQPLIKQIIAGDNLAAQLKVGTSVKQGKSYNVKFWASAPGGANLNIYFYNKDTGQKSAFNASTTVNVAGGGGWQIYSANLENLDHIVSPNEILAITANRDFYLDNFILTEITDRYYLIKASSQIPNICYYDIYDNYQGPEYNLGCTAYTDRSGINHNLHSFSSLCSADSVGCEQVIATQNYAPYGANIWGDSNSNGNCDSAEPDCIKVEKDAAMYLVYDVSKQCSAANLGCSRLGQAQAGTAGGAWSDVFKKNNPNRYDQILCGLDGLGCEEWQSADGGGLSYFRDPGSSFCVYRNSQAQAGGQKAWYKAQTKRCDINSDNVISGTEQQGPICASNDDCGGRNCIIDTNDYPCDISYFETIGYGGAGNRVPVPSKEAGLCEVKASGCREYIDPVSRFNPNLVISTTAPVIIQPNKLYVLTSATTTPVNATLNTFRTNTGAVAGVFPLLPDNTFGTSTASIQINSTTQNFIFHSGNSSRATINNQNAAVRELAVEYQTISSVDKQSCNGLVDFNNGCILFNERMIAGASGYTTNNFDPYNTLERTAPKSCVGSGCLANQFTANQLIKVRPDRVCASWLSCATYAYDEQGNRVCYALQQCNSIDDNGECINFLPNTYEPILENATGYYFLGKDNISKMKELGLNSGAHYDFEELVPALACSRLDNTGQPCSFDRNIVKDLIIREPEQARVDYPVSGKSYLRVPSAYSVNPHAPGDYVSLAPGQKYYINFLLNTKNSASAAEIMIAPLNNQPGATRFIASSSDGWSRKIFEFTTDNVGNNIRAAIVLKAQNSSNEGEIYFDDINIEPILQTSTSTYAARECRLYPDNSSLSCKDQNKDVIKNGLEGYCLERDRDNKGVCLTWYPVDRISSSLMGSTSLGYNGPSGLSYCTNINSNIKFAKKISHKFVYFGIDTTRGAFLNGIRNDLNGCPDDYDNPNNPYYVCKYCQSYQMTTTTQQMCIDNYNLRYDVSSCDRCVRQAGWDGVVAMDTDGCVDLGSNAAVTYCGSSLHYKAIAVNEKKNFNHERVYCIPNKDSEAMLLPIGPEISMRMLSEGAPAVTSCNDITFHREAWMEYDGKLNQVPVVQCQERDDIDFECEPIDEFNNADPPIRIYNPDYPPVDEQGLQFLAADKGDRDKVFNFTCNTFTQMVSSSGDNKAWAVRTGISSDPAHAFETPGYFAATNTAMQLANLQKYGRQRNGVPFGAATFGPEYDLLNSGPVYLQNQYYQKDNKTIFGGRPYGCTGSACSNIGYCSDNPNVLCIYYPQPSTATTTHYINAKTCSDGGFGVCQRLWTVNLANNAGVAAQDALTKLFVQAYGRFTYRDGAYIPSAISFDANTIRTAPRIDNVQLVKTNPGISTGGVYTLKFNTWVDPEQQPLKMVYINWGDDSQQAITGNDHRPDSNNPHVFYHYYTSTPSLSAITIRVWDNWDNTAIWPR